MQKNICALQQLLKRLYFYIAKSREIGFTLLHQRQIHGIVTTILITIGSSTTILNNDRERATRKSNTIAEVA